MSTKISSTDNRQEIMDQSRAALPDAILALIDEVNRRTHPKSHVIGVLHKVQEHYGYLPRPQLDAVAQLMQIPTSKITGMATFYHFFRLTPRGRFVIQVCLGTACYVQGAERVVERLQEELGIAFGETTSDGLFSLEPARCLGTCAMAPVVLIGERIHGSMTPDKVPAMLEEYVNQARAEDKGGETDTEDDA